MKLVRRRSTSCYTWWLSNKSVKIPLKHDFKLFLFSGRAWSWTIPDVQDVSISIPGQDFRHLLCQTSLPWTQAFTQLLQWTRIWGKVSKTGQDDANLTVYSGRMRGPVYLETPAPPPYGEEWCTTCQSWPPCPPRFLPRRCSPVSWRYPVPSTPWWREPCTTVILISPGQEESQALLL